MVGITASDHLPSIRVRRQAEFLHGVWPLAALDFFAGVGECLAGDQVEWSLYRLDLFVDVQGWDLHGDDHHQFGCRAERRDLHEHDGDFGGFEPGRLIPKTVCARILPV